MAQILKFRKRITTNLVQKDEAANTRLRGDAICLGCKHEWTALASIGESEFQCPKCTAKKGILKSFIDFRNESYYKCSNCDNPYFFVLANGDKQCPICGVLMITFENEE